MIVPRLQQLYAWSAHELAAPGLLDCVRDGALTYAWSFEDRGVWQPPKSFILQMTQRALPLARRDRGPSERQTTLGRGMGRPPAKGQAGEQDGPRSR